MSVFPNLLNMPSNAFTLALGLFSNLRNKTHANLSYFCLSTVLLHCVVTLLLHNNILYRQLVFSYPYCTLCAVGRYILNKYFYSLLCSQKINKDIYIVDIYFIYLYSVIFYFPCPCYSFKYNIPVVCTVTFNLFLIYTFKLPAVHLYKTVIHIP
jgi:hypothetical protein